MDELFFFLSQFKHHSVDELCFCKPVKTSHCGLIVGKVPLGDVLQVGSESVARLCNGKRPASKLQHPELGGKKWGTKKDKHMSC